MGQQSLRNYIVQEKTKHTCLERYGSEYYFTSQKCRNIIKEKYGVEFPLQNKEIFNKTKQSCIEKYGISNPTGFRTDSFKEKMINKYGVETWSKTPEFKKFMSEHKDEINDKRNQTKRRNQTFNTSKPEEETYIFLKEQYPDVVGQYKSKEYPWYCDFYIPSYNLYIELQI